MADFTFPDSVQLYLTEAEVHTAVNALVGKTLERVPPVDWPQLPDYYAATLAALQVQVDWARSLASLWDVAWSGCLPDLTPLSPIDQDRSLWDTNSVKACWDDNRFVRVFHRGDEYVSAAVRFDQSNLFVGVGRWTRKGADWIDHELSAPGHQPSVDGILWSREDLIPYRPPVSSVAIAAVTSAMLAIALGASPSLLP